MTIGIVERSTSPGSKLKARLERPVLSQQESVGAHGGLGLAGTTAREREQRRRVRRGGVVLRKWRRPFELSPPNRTRHRHADHELVRDLPQGRRPQPQQVRFRPGNQTARPAESTTALHVVATGRGIEEHRDHSQPKQRKQRDVELRRHRVKYEHRVAGSQSRSPEQCRRLGRGSLQLRERRGAIASAGAIENGHGRAAARACSCRISTRFMIDPRAAGQKACSAGSPAPYVR